MNTNKEKMMYLYEELREYEKITPMDSEERRLLREWVAEGHSVHENASLACWEGGIPLDFLDAYRQEKEETDMLAAMSETERQAYLSEQYGTEQLHRPPSYADSEDHIRQHQDDEMTFEVSDRL